ncbi:MAG: ABC transporter permease [Lachnospiraceae bacterium]|nr:ABC transporter permease [Lachnospiraceae bacterium]
MKLKAMIIRNVKLFFKDKGMFFTSMVTPMILLVLYVTFLGKTYTDSFRAAVPEGHMFSDGLIEATVGGELISSILAVCCVTVAFCSNMLMVQDKVSGARNDLLIAPVKRSVLALGYYIATVFSTLIVCVVALGAGLLYVRSVGWYMSVSDIAWILLDIVILVLFGTALSSIINIFLSTQGQISAVGTIVSAGYGFICGAYMPISNFGEGLRKVLSFLPGTYGTSLLRNHAMRGVFGQMRADGFPAEVVEGIKESVDCKLYFFGNEVTTTMMYLYLGATVIVLIAVYVLLHAGTRTRK